MPFTATRMDPEIITPSEVSQKEKDKNLYKVISDNLYHLDPYIRI